jgi:hypothetical protein
MTGEEQKTLSGKEKTTTALEALRERQSLGGTAQKYEVPSQDRSTGSVL